MLIVVAIVIVLVLIIVVVVMWIKKKDGKHCSSHAVRYRRCGDNPRGSALAGNSDVIRTQSRDDDDVTGPKPFVANQSRAGRRMGVEAAKKLFV